MRTGRAAGGTHKANDVATMHLLPGGRFESGQMSVPRHDAVPVVDFNEVPVASAALRHGDGAVGCRADGLTVVGGDVETRMEICAAGERVTSVAIPRREPAGHGPDRRGCRGQRLPA